MGVLYGIFLARANFFSTFFQRIITNQQQHNEPMTTQRKTRRRMSETRSKITTARAIKIAGGSVSGLAERLGITVQAVYKWGDGGIPCKQARKLLEVKA